MTTSHSPDAESKLFGVSANAMAATDTCQEGQVHGQLAGTAGRPNWLKELDLRSLRLGIREALAGLR